MCHDVVSHHLDIPTPDGRADAYLAHPADSGSYPAVLCYMDIYGLRPAFTQMVDRIAVAGYVVLAPHVFYRHGRDPLVPLGDLLDPVNRASVAERLRGYLSAVDPGEATRDAAAYLDHLAADPRVLDGPVGVVGYCMGGNLGLRTAAAYPDRVAALASFHGGDLATTAADSPHRQVGRIQAECYFAHADNDPSASTEQVERFQTALREAGVSYRSEVYTGCAHGFTQRDSPAFDQSASARHWAELLQLFDRALSGG
ncbi:MAG TPA: dienelactone hydrolase family protein [Dermatophilaceae bacterium]|nr:dienelactone hydrolase family protein [Dermatophilaceae bacterium]